MLTAGKVDVVCVHFNKLHNHAVFSPPTTLYLHPRLQATITVKGAPERKLNTTYDRVPYEHPKKGEKDLRPVACYRSGHGCSLYQLARGNWGLSHSEKSWVNLKCNYATWERGRGHYGHAPESKLTW